MLKKTLAIVAFVALVTGCSIPSLSPTPKPTREEMRAMLDGKTPADTLAILGQPDDTMETESGKPRAWSWRAKTRNAVNGKPDSWIFVHFDNDGRVTKVNFD